MLLVALSVAFRHATEMYLEFDATSHVLFLNQSVLADFDDRKKKSDFKTRSLSGTSKKKPKRESMGHLRNETVTKHEKF